MKAKFDDLTIRNLKPESNQYSCMAEKEPGFGIRVHPTGTMTFFYQYKVDGNRRYMALGNYPSTSLKMARELYQAELAKVKALRRGSADGVDPVPARRHEASCLYAGVMVKTTIGGYMPKAHLLVRVKESVSGGIREIVIWLLDEPLPGCNHRLKYRLYFGISGGKCLVRYDNERGKGDHRHVLGKEEPYSFTTVDSLIDDFDNDVRRLP